MKILKHPIFATCTCDKCMTVFQADANDELETVCREGVIQAWKIECPVCRHWCNIEWAGIINPSDVTDTNVGLKPFSCDHEKGGDWISVDERLPERNGRYLTHCKIEGQSLVCILYYCNVGGFNEGTVTHWMPLPEPPKGDAT